MKILFYFITLILFVECNSIKNPSVENDIFIASLSNDFDSTGKFILKNPESAIRFSKDFWNYFIRTHPLSSSKLFISPLNDPSNNYVSLADTSFTFYNISHSNSIYFIKLLADSAGGKEKRNSFTGSAFVVTSNDTNSDKIKEKRIEENLNDYKITPSIRDEFNRFRKILTGTDTSDHYIIVFKKNFVENIYKLYE